MRFDLKFLEMISVPFHKKQTHFSCPIGRFINAYQVFVVWPDLGKVAHMSPTRKCLLKIRQNGCFFFLTIYVSEALLCRVLVTLDLINSMYWLVLTLCSLFMFAVLYNFMFNGHLFMQNKKVKKKMKSFIICVSFILSIFSYQSIFLKMKKW